MIFISRNQPAWRQGMIFFAGQGPANDDSLRIPAEAEVAPVKSGQQETGHDFYLGPRQIKIMPCLDRGGARLPGDRACFFFRGPAKFPSTRHDFWAREIKIMPCPK